MDGVHFFYTTDTPVLSSSSDKVTADPQAMVAADLRAAEGGIDAQFRCILVFKDEESYNEFQDSKSLAQFLTAHKDLWHDYHITEFEVNSKR